MASESVLAFLDAMKQGGQELHSFMLARRGHVVAEGWWSPYRPELPHSLNSLSKSFVSAAIGLAVAEGKLTARDDIAAFFPKEAAAAGPRETARLKVRHLLTMSTGHSQDTISAMLLSDNWAAAFLNAPPEHEPGTRFMYHTGATYMLSAILHKAAGCHLLDYLRRRLFDPLGIEAEGHATCPRGIHAGGYGLSMRTEDVAKFGLLLLRQGIWNGERLLPEGWVEEATSAHIPTGADASNDWAQGYGYQFWRCRHGAYRGDGAYGQFCVVMPEQDSVVVMTGAIANMPFALEGIWAHLLPGMSGDSTRPAVRLAEKLSRLVLEPPERGCLLPEDPDRFSRRYAVELNRSGISALAFSFGEKTDSVSFDDSAGPQTMIVGHGQWERNEVRLAGIRVLAEASGRWLTRTDYEITLRLPETPYCDVWLCRFEDDRVRMDVNRNVEVYGGITDVALLPGLSGKSPN
ncbi:serine hydrolase domain-containing protein [Cohnella suwonensis]|uniref:Serine hydrolase domain-containing protein n=1 Tax=Cohnella suwonensis TaxID=696072 RepID=A0ABW0M0P7_9BACL